MPDTKSGRERKGRNKRSQLQERLYEREMQALDADEELPPLDVDSEGRLLADELPDET